MGVACSAGLIEKSAEESVSKSKKRFKTFKSFGKRKTGEAYDQSIKSPVDDDSGETRFSFCGDFFPSTPCKSVDATRSSFTGRVGLERAMEVLDALGSGVANFNSSGFISGFTVRGNKIDILAFEVANTISKGASLMQSLSEENVRHVKEKVFVAEGVQRLVSSDSKVLLSITAADKREELDVFCREIVRFGNLCKDPQWHNLNRFFAKMHSGHNAYGFPREEAELKMHELTVLAHNTAGLYHELNALDRFEQDYNRQKHEDAESFDLSCRESITILQSELKHHKKLVMSFKRKSLWSKRMEEIVEKLVDIVAFMHQRISEVFGSIDNEEIAQELFTRRLGVSGLALHYANLTNQIDNIASRPSYLPANTRDSLYNGLPTTVKHALHSTLRHSDSITKLSISQIKSEMDKILKWLVPMASNTTKLSRGFGWVGEWASTSNDFRNQAVTTGNLTRLQTLHHADKQKTDAYILQLVTWLHHLHNAAKQREHGFISSLPDRTSTQKVRRLSLGGGKPIRVTLSREETNLLEKVTQVQPLLNVSKSQDFASIRRRSFKMRHSCRRSRSSRDKEFNRKEAEVYDGDVDDSDFEVLNRLDLAY